MATQACIEVEGLYKRYGRVEALKGVTLRVECGSIVAVLGPNGAGKTTLLRAVSGTLRVTAGRVRVMGLDVVENPVTARSIIGFVSEHPMLFPELSVQDNILLSARLHGLKASRLKDRFKSLLEELGLWEYRDRLYGRLSKGLQRRADIASALVHDPRILILDEPTSGLDIISAISLRRIIKDLNKKGVTIILATHNIPEAMEISSYAFILNNGAIVAQGPPAKLREVIGGREDVVIAEVRGDVEKVKELLVGRGVRATVEGGYLHIEGSASVVIPRLFEAVEKAGGEVARIAVKELEWEEVFMRIISSCKPRRECPQECPVLKAMRSG
ncbi:ABC transporter ATP-binding protein [Thermogladius sp. 4427co]|uniref:ABC transporter ATP-binding protein n=1 Tax=Thermogladius sp. 4427co TaxID=3450718 RepID=UPI003F78F522